MRRTALWRATRRSVMLARMATPIRIDAADDGTLIYRIDCHPADLPAVSSRDILRAWEIAHDAARRAKTWPEAGFTIPRAFAFRASDDHWANLALQDRDARCWAGAVDRTLGLQTTYGLSVCLRLLALVGLLARAPWATSLVRLRDGDASLHPALLRLAAEARLTDDAGFDDASFHAHLQSLPILASSGQNRLKEPLLS